MIARNTHAGPARIALLGCGTVGREVAARLLERGPALGLELIGIAVRDPSRDRALPPQLFTGRAADLLDRSPDLVIELIGGIDAAGPLVERCLRRSIPVVTANKTLIAHRAEELDELARRAGARLAFEASVCAGVPVLAALRQLEADRVLAIRGVVNGTCNYLLSRMEAGLPFARALAEAQDRGLAEADPSADISGRDSAEKLCVLAAAAGFRGVRPEHVARTGIEQITPEDLADARRQRRTIRLVAELDPACGLLRVGPVLLPRDHPLAMARAEENALMVTAELAGDLYFRGPGAGPLPTASAVLGDAVRLLADRKQAPCRPAERRAIILRSQQARRHYLRVGGRAADPDEVLRVVRGHGTTPHEVALARRRVWAELTADEPAAHACARELAGPHGQALVLPLLACQFGNGGASGG